MQREGLSWSFGVVRSAKQNTKCARRGRGLGVGGELKGVSCQ